MRLLLILLVFTSPFAAAFTVRYPTPPIENDVRAEFAREMTELALSKGAEPWTFVFNGLPMERARMEHELARGETVNVLMLPGRPTYDEKYLKVPVALDKGLLGLRVGLVMKDQKDIFEQIYTLEQLRALTVCSNKTWSVTKIFRDNNLPIIESTEFRHNFRQLMAKRCHYFSRGLSEIEHELEEYSEEFPGMTIDPYVVVNSDLAFYLYVSSRHPELHEALSDGLEKAKKDGSFDLLFDKYFGSTVQSLNLHGRTQIDLD